MKLADDTDAVTLGLVAATAARSSSRTREAEMQSTMKLSFPIRRDKDPVYFWSIFFQAQCESEDGTWTLEQQLYELLYGEQVDLADDDLSCDNVWFQRYTDESFPGVEVLITGAASTKEPRLCPLLSALDDLLGERLREAIPGVSFVIDVGKACRGGVAGVPGRFRPITPTEVG